MSATLIGLDYAILALLPDEGMTLGFASLAKQAKAIVTELNDQLGPDDPRVRSSQVNGRLRSLKSWGLIIDCDVQPVSRGKGWQRTENGRDLVRRHAS